MIGTVVLLTGLTTNVACITSVADYFAQRFTWLSYRQWVLVHAGVGLLIANFGLQTVLDTALPVLFLLYPLGMTLIALTLLDRFFGGRRPVYVGAVIGAGTVAVLDAVKTAGLLTDQINDWFSFLPLFADNAGWIIPAIIGGLLGALWARATGSPALPVDRDAAPDVSTAPGTGADTTPDDRKVTS